MEQYQLDVKAGREDGDWRRIENEKWFEKWRQECDFNIERLYHQKTDRLE